jgi:predicted nucleic acid-binding protein
MAWCFPDEMSARADVVLELLEHDEAIVPALWPFEVLNVLVFGERRNRIKSERADHFLSFLKTLKIIVEQSTAPAALETILSLARTYQLTAYDASYLELAIRRGLPLATLDERLSKAAARAGIALLCPQTL